MTWSSFWSTAEEGLLHRKRCNELYGGINERCTATGDSVTAILHEYDQGEFLNIEDWCSAWTTLRNTIYPKFIDHQDNSGIWTGQSSIPFYTEAILKTRLGVSDLLPAPKSLIGLGAWLKEQKAIIDLLLWTYTEFSSAFSVYKKDGADRTAEEATPEDAYSLGQTNWTSASYSLDGTYSSINLIYKKIYERAAADMWSPWDYDTYKIEETISPDYNGFTCDVDVYAHATLGTDVHSGNYKRTYYRQAPYATTGYVLLDSLSDKTNSFPVSFGYDDYTVKDTVSDMQPFETSDRASNLLYGASFDELGWVLKYNFQYKA